MTRVVADASAIVDLLSGAPTAAAIRAALADVPEVDVPEHFHVEAISAIRGLRLRNALSEERANRALDLLVSLRTLRHPVAPLTQEIWGMRDQLSAYDAAYVAVARMLDLQILTADRGLAAAAEADGRLLDVTAG